MKIRILILLVLMFIQGCSAKTVGNVASAVILLLFVAVFIVVVLSPYLVAISLIVYFAMRHTKEYKNRAASAKQMAERRQREAESLAQQLAEKRAAAAKQRAKELAEEKARLEQRIADAVLKQLDADHLKKQKATPQEEAAQRAEADRLKKQRAAQRAAAAKKRARELAEQKAAIKDWYRKESLRLHPDRGGSLAAMQKLNAEYERRLNKL